MISLKSYGNSLKSNIRMFIYIYIEREREREREAIYDFALSTKFLFVLYHINEHKGWN
jgi:hypothetical protein